MSEATITTTTPDGSTTRPVPPSWATVAPLLQRWRMALIPCRDGTWDVLTGYDSALQVRVWDARRVPWPAVPQTIQELAARCEAAEQGETR